MRHFVKRESTSLSFGRQFRVLNTLCTETSYAELREDLARHCDEPGRRTLSVDFTNVHIVAMRHGESAFREVTDTMDLFVPDSMVLTWAVNWQGGEMQDRVYGPSFLAHMIEHSPPGLRHFFLGASEQCLEKLLQVIRNRNPGFQIAGAHHGYFSPDEGEDVLRIINDTKPDFVWVGLGTPKQQEWMHRFHGRVNAGVLLAVGFAFDVNAGTKSDAPQWMHPLGLTWLYRLLEEPQRLWRRYLKYNSIFVWELFRDQMGLRRDVPSNRLSRISSEATGLDESIPSPLCKPPRCSVLGVGINAMDLERATQMVKEAAGNPGFCGFVTVTGVHGVMEAQRDAELRHIHNRSFLSTPDGMPMVWVSRWSGYEKVGRVYGPDLLLETVRSTAGTGLGHFFWGGKEGVAEKLAERMRALFPGTTVVGAVTPPFGELSGEEEEELAQRLRESRPGFLWVGLSTPRQERFMHGFLKRHPDLAAGWSHGLVLLGVGAAFDFHSGQVEQAPDWMQRRGLEWFFRLCMEPRRLWRRYSINNTGFVFAIIPQLMRWKSYRIEK